MQDVSLCKLIEAHASTQSKWINMNKTTVLSRSPSGRGRLKLVLTGIVSAAALIFLISFDIPDEDKEAQSRRFTTIKDITEDTKGCKDYSGILHIDKTDFWAGAGTAFFIYIVNYLNYAEEHNLLPWVHFNKGTGKIYDPEFHDAEDVVLKMVRGEIQDVDGEGSPPGEPNIDPNDYKLKPKEDVIINGNGIWETYFEPIKFNMNDESCTSKPLISFTYPQVYPGMHYCASWAVRAWNYGSNCEIPQFREHATPKPGETMHEWMGKQRKLAAHFVEKYFKPAKWLQEKIDNTNPRSADGPPCLAIHIRLSDKSGEDRNKNPLDMFLPFAKAFVDGGGRKIFLASDTAQVFDEVESLWPSDVVNTMTRQSDVFLSDSETAVFDQVSHHRSNTEALTEIYAMAKCDLMVHGYSGMTEAAIYLNPSLHDFSINLDYGEEERKSVDDFKEMVQKVLK